MSKPARQYPLTRKQVYALAAEAEVDPRTVASIYARTNSKGLVRTRVETAAKKLKIPAPLPPLVSR